MFANLFVTVSTVVVFEKTRLHVLLPYSPVDPRHGAALHLRVHAHVLRGALPDDGPEGRVHLEAAAVGRCPFEPPNLKETSEESCSAVPRTIMQIDIEALP